MNRKATQHLRALDLFCGAGGATKGLQRAGFHVTGIDIKPQPRYCGEAFVRADVITLLESDPAWRDGFDFIWASPPCQGYSRALKHLSSEQPQLIEPLRKLLQKTPVPYVIENVEGAPLVQPIRLCGLMFGRALYRHRLFEMSFPPMGTPPHWEHKVRASAAGHFEEETFISVAGHCNPILLAEAVMDIDWMNRDELVESIPPYFSEFIGKQAIKLLQEAPCD